MNGETIKDIRLSLKLVVNDLERLAADVKCLGEFLEPLEKEESNERNGTDFNWFLSRNNNNNTNNSIDKNKEG